MGLYNLLDASITCPRCGKFSEKVEFELFFGDRQIKRFKIGDIYQLKKAENINTTEGEGYAECPICSKDFFVKVEVEDSKIKFVEVNSEKFGYIN